MFKIYLILNKANSSSCYKSLHKYVCSHFNEKRTHFPFVLKITLKFLTDKNLPCGRARDISNSLIK